MKKPAPESMVLEILAEVAPSTAASERLASRACRSITACCLFRSILARIAAESSGSGLRCGPRPASGPCGSDGSMLLIPRTAEDEGARENSRSRIHATFKQ